VLNGIRSLLRPGNIWFGKGKLAKFLIIQDQAASCYSLWLFFFFLHYMVANGYMLYMIKLVGDDW
jgi:hypothetical protein